MYSAVSCISYEADQGGASTRSAQVSDDLMARSFGGVSVPVSKDSVAWLLVPPAKVIHQHWVPT